MSSLLDIVEITAGAHLPAEHYGARAQTLGRLLAQDIPVPKGFAISTAAVRKLALGEPVDLSPLADIFAPGRLWSIRRAPQRREWGGPRALLNLGMTDANRAHLADTLGQTAAADQYCRFIRTYSLKVARLDEDDLEELVEAEFTTKGLCHSHLAEKLLEFYADETGEPFPQ
ncbi:MAG: pyruvate, phosphate dikinase, partial [Pseudomonadota bacterium]